MKTGFRPRAAFAVAALSCAPATLWAADAALVYNQRYTCGKEIVEVAYCRRDSDRQDQAPTPDSMNYCQVYYHDRPKNGMGGTAFGTELKSEIEQRLRGCGALAATRTAARPATGDKPGPAQAIQKSPQSAAQRAALGEMMRGQQLYEAKDYKGAIAAFQAAVPLTPDAVTAARAFAWIASAYRELGNYEQSITALRESLRLAPGNSGTQFSLGWVYHLTKRYPEALSSLQESARLKPTDAEVHYWIGEVHQFGLKQYEKSLAAYGESLRLRPNDARTINQMGLAHNELGQISAALASFNEAVRLKPGEPLYYSNLALAHAQMGRYDLAGRVADALRKINAKKADELDKTLMDWQIVDTVDGKTKP